MRSEQVNMADPDSELPNGGSNENTEVSDTPAAFLPESPADHGKSPFFDSSLDQDEALMDSLKVDSPSSAMSSDIVKDLCVVVDDPEKHVGGYVSYNINTKTTRGEFDQPEYNVRRRYQDFLWLRQRLEEAYPTHIVPPLPEKHSISKRFDRFSTEFLQSRQIALNKFLNRIADHPVMSFNDCLHIFLTAKSWELTSVKKQSPGLMSRMSDSMRGMASSWMLKTREPEFQDMAEYVKNFREKIVTMESISDKIAKERFDVLESYKEYSPIYRLWANSETKLATPLLATADAVDKSGTALKRLLKSQDSRFMGPLHEYILHSDAVRAALKQRDTIQMEYEVTLEELSRKRGEKEELEKVGSGGRSFSLFTKDPEQAKEEKRGRLDSNIEELTKLVESGADRLECANSDLKADIERWHENKRDDFSALLAEYADRHVACYQECLEAWQTALRALGSDEDEPDAQDS